jgi:hypothetical protein
MIHPFSSIAKKYSLIFICFILQACSTDDQNLLTFDLIIENHRFIPDEIKVPANTKFKIIVHNKDATAEEFECPKARREKIIPPNAKVSITIAPLEQGTFEFFGDFNPDEAKGRFKVE